LYAAKCPDKDGHGYHNRALPGFVWVEIQASAVEEDGRLEVLGVAEAAGGLLHPLDDRVDALEAGVGDAVAQVGEQVRQAALDELGDGRHGLKWGVGGPPVPAGEEAAGGPGIAILPEGPEPFLERPRPPHLEVFPLQDSQDRSVLGRQLGGATQPEVL